MKAIAAEFYAMAGENKQAETVQKQTEQRQAQAEEGRKKTFKKSRPIWKSARFLSLRRTALVSC